MKNPVASSNRETFFTTFVKKEKYSPTVTPAAALYVTLRVPTLDLLMGWAGQLWSKTDFLNWQN